MNGADSRTTLYIVEVIYSKDVVRGPIRETFGVRMLSMQAIYLLVLLHRLGMR
jgi:hypothetical protein